MIESVGEIWLKSVGVYECVGGIRLRGNERYDHLFYPILNLRMIDLIPAIYWLYAFHIQKRFKIKIYERKIARGFITVDIT